MKLPENLKRIRKENGLSQEQFAEKLGVSRQAVSKWESGQSYPEMDKVLSICKMFNYNIDELLNENIKEVAENKKSNINLNKYIEDFFGFVTKTVRMFESMKFSSKLKCIIEQVIIALVMCIAFFMFKAIFSGAFVGMFNWLPSTVYRVVINILSSIYIIFVIVASAVLMLHIFKIRYLDYYDIIEEKINTVENKNKKIEPSSSKIVVEKNKERIIIRDPVHSESKFLNGILKVIIFGIKAFAAFCGVGFVFTLIGLCVALICSFLFVKTGLVFVGALGCILSSIVINVVILKIIYNFIVNRKSSFSKIWIIVISSILVFGISLGMAMIGFTKFDNVSGANGENIKVEKVEYAFDEKMYFRVYGDVEYIESDNDDVKVEVYYTDKYTPKIYREKSRIYIDYSVKNNNFFDTLRQNIQDINNKKIVDYEYFKVKIYTNKNNIDILKDNM